MNCIDFSPFQLVSEISQISFVHYAAIGCVETGQFSIIVILTTDYVMPGVLEELSDLFKRFSVGFILPYIDHSDNRVRFSFDISSIGDFVFSVDNSDNE